MRLIHIEEKWYSGVVLCGRTRHALSVITMRTYLTGRKPWGGKEYCMACEEMVQELRPVEFEMRELNGLEL